MLLLDVSFQNPYDGLFQTLRQINACQMKYIMLEDSRV